MDQSLAAQATTSGGEGGSLMGAVTSLPALMEKKKGLEQHTAILQATMDLVMAREVPMLRTVGPGHQKACIRDDLDL